MHHKNVHKLILTAVGSFCISTGATGQSCGDGRDSVPSLGINTYYCRGGSCRIDGASAVVAPATKRDLPFRFDFSVEPSLWDIDVNGPSSGKVEDGDVLVAINGRGVTTVEGSRELEQLNVGVPTELTIRRDRRLVDVDVTPIATCKRLTIAAGSSASPRNMTLVGRAPVEQLLSRRTRASVMGVGVDTWGMALACSRCREVRGQDGRLVWQFEEHPVVVSVTEGGAAGRAGLRIGDIVTHINGDDLLTTVGSAHLRDAARQGMHEVRYARGGVAQRVVIRTRAGSY